MKRKLIITISILMICFMTSCKSFKQIKDTNGPDDYTLNTITDEDIIKGFNSVSIGSIDSSKNNVYNLKVNKFSGVNRIYKKDFKDKTITLEITSKVESGNFKIAIVVDDKIVETIPANTTKTVVTEVTKGNYSIRVAGEETKFTLTYKMTIK